MTEAVIDAARLFDAAETARPIDPLSAMRTVELADAYAIQDLVLARRVAREERLVGLRFDVKTATSGWLTDRMRLPLGEAARRELLLQPRVAPHLAFLIGDRLDEPGLGVPEVMAATVSVSAALEVTDSRYNSSNCTLGDVVADNCGAAYFLLGPSRPADQLDLPRLGVLLEDGVDVVHTGAGAAVLGHPAEAVARIAGQLGARGRAIEPGMVVLSGAITETVPLEAHSRLAATFAHLGRVALLAS